MSFQHYVGSFSVRSGTGTQSITGVGFTPKVVLFFSAATGGAADDYAIFTLGMDDGVTAYTHGVETVQGATPPQLSAGGSLSGSSIQRVTGGGLASILEAHISAMTSDGFTLSVTVNTLSQNEVIRFVAYGGSDLDYEIFTMTPDGTANQLVSGLSLAPKAVIAVWIGTTTGVGPSWHHGVTFVAPSNATTLATADRSATPTSDNGRYLRNGRAFATLTDDGASVIREADAVTFTSDGMGIHWSTPLGGAGFWACLALGGSVQGAVAGVFDTATSAGTDVVTVASNDPAVVLFGSVCAAASATPTRGAGLSIGAADTVNTGGACWMGATFGAATSVAAKGTTSSGAVYVATPTNPGSSSAIHALAPMTASSPTSLTLDYASVGSPSAIECMYLTMGTTTAIVDPPPEADDDPCSITTPLYWVAVQPSAELGDVLQGAQTPLRDPATYYGGFKPALVLGIGAITRAASDYLTGSLPAQTASVVWADTRRFVRNVFGTLRDEFTSSPLWIYLIDNVTRLALGVPRLLFYGFISEDPLSQDLTYTTNANDLVGKDYSLLGDEVLIPKRTFNLEQFPNTPARAEPYGVPIIGGDVNYAVDNLVGAIKLIDLGDFECQDSVIRRCLGVAGHACKSITLFQAGVAIPSGDFGINAWAPGETGWTDIVPSNAPVVTLDDGRDYALVFVSGKRAKTLDMETTAVVIATVTSAASNVVFTVGSGEAAQFTSGDEIDIRLAANSNEPELRAISTVVGDTITITEPLSGTPAAGDTVQPSALVVPDGLDGFVYADVQGMDDAADSTGTLMEDLLLLDRHVLENFIFGDYQGGPWLDQPTFEFYPGGAVSYLLDRESWDAASAIGAGYMGGSPSTPFKGAFVIGVHGRRQSTRQVMADFARSGNFLRAWRGNNQFFVTMLDRNRTAFLGSRPTITDRRDILSNPRFAPLPMKDWLCNNLTSRYAANYRDDGHGEWNASINHGNATSADLYGPKPKVETYPMVRDEDTANIVNQQRLDFLSVLRQVWTWGQSLCALKTSELLTGVAVTHYGGKGGSGFIDHAMWVEKQVAMPSTSSVLISAVDVDDLVTVGSAAPPPSDELLASSSDLISG